MLKNLILLTKVILFNFISDGINTYGIVVMFIAAMKYLKLQK